MGGPDLDREARTVSGLHLALAVEDGAFLDDQFAGAHVADQDRFRFKNDTVVGGHVSSDLATDLSRGGLDLALDRTLDVDGNRAGRPDGAFDGAFDREVVFDEEFAGDDRARVDEGEAFAAGGFFCHCLPYHSNHGIDGKSVNGDPYANMRGSLSAGGGCFGECLPAMNDVTGLDLELTEVTNETFDSIRQEKFHGETHGWIPSGRSDDSVIGTGNRFTGRSEKDSLVHGRVRCPGLDGLWDQSPIAQEGGEVDRVEFVLMGLVQKFRFGAVGADVGQEGFSGVVVEQSRALGGGLDGAGFRIVQEGLGQGHQRLLPLGHPVHFFLEL